MNKRSLSLLMILCLLLSLFPASAFADEPVRGSEPTLVASGTCGAEGDNLSWTLVTQDTERFTDAGKLTISGTGDMADYSSYNLPPWDEYSDDIVFLAVEEGVTSIGQCAFDVWTCYHNLYEVSLPGSLREIGTRAFRACEYVEELSLPEGLEVIGEGAFAACTGLSEILLPESLTTIGAEAFSGCTGLTEILIPAGVTSVDNDSFYACTNLTAINVAPDNRVYSSQGGTLFDKAGETLISYPYGRAGAYTVPSGTVTLAAFSFYGCQGLTALTIPETVTEIGMRAFLGCSGLTDVYYAGTEEQMEALLANGWEIDGNDPLFDAAWYCGASVGPGIIASGTCGLQGDNLTWTLDSEGTLTISGTGDMADYDYCSLSAASYSQAAPWFSLRETINRAELGSGVTSIGNYAFQYCVTLMDITLPSSMTSIGESAFFSCINLKSFILPESVATIAATAYLYCINLTGIDVAKENPYFISRDGVLFNKAQTELICYPAGITGDYQVPTSVTSLGSFAFYNSIITSISIPDSVTSIGEFTFENCKNVTSITLPAGVANIGDGAFAACESLTEIRTVEANPYYSSLDGALFNKAQTELLCYPAGKTGNYQVPDNVTVIGMGAFCGCSSLTDIFLPTCVNSIDYCAFLFCLKLTSIAIPASVTSIGERAFENCNALTDVYFGGTEQQRIEREGNGWATDGNDSLFNAAWHYGGALPDFDGILPADLKTVEEEALAGTAFRAVRIPDGAEAIGARAFAGSPDLEYVYIPESVTAIAEDAFAQASGLTIIGQAGSAAEAFANAHGFAFIAG